MLTAGPETDLAVAKACGYVAEVMQLQTRICFRTAGLNEPIDAVWRKVFGEQERRLPFRPSTDLNDAFLAADKFGLFDGEFRCALGKWTGIHWKLIWDTEEGQPDLPMADTPALAICAAILKLAESQPCA